MRVDVVPHQDDRAAELLVGGIEQADVVLLGKALLLVLALVVDQAAVDEPGRVFGPGLVGEQSCE